mgnify:CR=1 FL=1
MRARDSFVAEFDHEMAVTRRVLERVPEEAFSWKPHEKSFSLGGPQQAQKSPVAGRMTAAPLDSM